MDIISEKVNQIKEFIRNTDRYRFLQRNVDIIECIQNLLTNPTNKLSGDLNLDNAVLTINNGFTFIKDDQWNNFYYILYKITYIDFDTLEIDNEMIEPTKIKNYDKYYLSAYFKECYDSITSLTNKSSNVIKSLLLYDSALTKKLIVITLQQLSFQYNRYKKTDQMSIPLTVMLNKVGSNLLELLLLQNPLFKNFINYTKELESMTPRNDILMKKLLIEINKKDTSEKTYNKIYITIFNEKFVNQNNDLLPIINMYVCDLIYEYNKRSIKTSIYSHLFNNTDFNFNENKLKLTKALIKATSFFMDTCKETYKNGMLPALFKISKKQNSIEKNKSKKMVVFNELFINALSEIPSNNKPYLTKNNIDYLKIMAKKDNLSNILYGYKERVIHSNNDITLKIKKECYLTYDKPLIKTCIDLDAFYCLLTRIERVQNNAELSMSLCETLYEIDLISMGKAIPYDIFNKYAYRLALWGLSFNEESEKTFSDLDKIKNDTTHPYYTIYNAIKSKKFILKGTLKDVVLYMIFKNFLLDGFLDSRGRFYINCDFLNIQLFPFNKTLIKPYKMQRDCKESFDLYKKTISRHLHDHNLKYKLEAMDFTQYQKTKKELLLEYIRNHFKKDSAISFDTSSYYAQILVLIKDIFDDNKDNPLWYDQELLLLYMNKCIKKKNRSLYIISLLNLELNKKDYDWIEFYVEQDASASGLQMLSILLKSESMGNMCNILGTKKKDPYMDIVNVFKYDMRMLVWITHNFNIDIKAANILYKENHLKQTMPKHIHKDDFLLLETKTLEEIWLTIIQMDLERSSYAIPLLNLFYTKIKDIINVKEFLKRHDNFEGNEHNKFDINNYKWILNTHEFLLLNSFSYIMDKETLILLLILRNSTKMYSYFYKYHIPQNTKFWTTRTLFKDALMTYFYNSTSYGRQETFKQELYKLLPNANKNHYMTNKDINYLSLQLDNYFIYYVKKNIPDSQLMKNITNIFAENKTEVPMDNEFFKITYKPKITLETSIELPRNKKKRGYQLNLKSNTDAFNSYRFKNGFMPNFIHSLDAVVAHYFLSKMVFINYELTLFNLTIFYATNHDNFITDQSPFLKIIVEDCYLQLYKSAPFQMLIKSRSNEVKKHLELLLANRTFILKSLNPNFIS